MDRYAVPCLTREPAASALRPPLWAGGGRGSTGSCGKSRRGEEPVKDRKRYLLGPPGGVRSIAISTSVGLSVCLSVRSVT